eukprot:g81028.t1
MVLTSALLYCTVLYCDVFNPGSFLEELVHNWNPHRCSVALRMKPCDVFNRVIQQRNKMCLIMFIKVKQYHFDKIHRDEGSDGGAGSIGDFVEEEQELEGKDDFNHCLVDNQLEEEDNKLLEEEGLQWIQHLKDIEVRSQCGDQADEPSSDGDMRGEGARGFVPVQQQETFQKLNEQYVFNMQQKFAAKYKGEGKFPDDAVWYKQNELESFVSSHGFFRIPGEMIRKRKELYETMLARAGSASTIADSKLRLGSLHYKVLRKRKKTTEGSAEQSPKEKKRKKKTASKTKSKTRIIKEVERQEATEIRKQEAT